MKHHAAGLETCANQLRSEDGIRSLVSKRGNAWASQRGKHVMVRFNVSLQDFPSTLVSICKYVGQLSLPLRPGGQKIVILLFSRAGCEKCNITIIDFDVKNVGEVKNVSYESSGHKHMHCAGTSDAEAFQLYIYIA
jgi:hypothetical protein